MPEILCPGLDGGNPAGFLATIGVLACVPGARLGWTDRPRPWLAVIESPYESVEALAGAILTAPDPAPIGSDHPWYLIRSAASGGGDTDAARYAAYVAATRADMTRESIVRDLATRWIYPDPGDGRNLRLDPYGVSPPRALSWSDPSRTPHGISAAAQWLGAKGIEALGLATDPSPLGWREHEDGQWFAWPIWRRPIDLDMIRSLLSLADVGTGIGLADRYASRRRRTLPGRGPSSIEMAPAIGAAWQWPYLD